jgi:purine-nucleoside phosphorylase
VWSGALPPGAESPTPPAALSCAPVRLEQPVRVLHLRPAAELAERVLLPGDPHRALVVAQALLDEPRMFNHSRGLWGYTGRAPDGEPLTVQSTGMGGPSAAIVVEELIALGADRLVRIGTCGALHEGLALGELLAAETVIPADGASAALGAGPTLRPDPGLTGALAAAGARPATVVSTDLFFDPRPAGELGWDERGAAAVEMEGAAVLQVAARRGAAAACLLAVTDVPAPGGARRMEPAELESVGVRLGEVGYRALAAP